jgi:hypothetical protein
MLTRAVEHATRAVEEAYYTTGGECHERARAAVKAIMPWIDASNLERFVGRAIATLERG